MQWPTKTIVREWRATQSAEGFRLPAGNAPWFPVDPVSVARWAIA